MKFNAAELRRGRVRIQIQLSSRRVGSSPFYQLSPLHSTAQRMCRSAKAKLGKTWGIFLVFRIFSWKSVLVSDSRSSIEKSHLVEETSRELDKPCCWYS